MNTFRSTVLFVAGGAAALALYSACVNGGMAPAAKGVDAVRITMEPDWFEPYRIALGYRVGDLLYLSGQASIDESGNIVGSGDFDAQVKQTVRNVEKVLKAGGSSLDKVVKVNIYLTDMKHFPKIMELREKYFTPPYPADTIVEVQALALPELMIEIEAIALVGGEIIDE